MNRATIIVLVVGVVSMSGVALWMLIPRDVAPVGTELPPTAQEEQRRQRAESFFGGDPDRDVRGGQEMKPRW